MTWDPLSGRGDDTMNVASSLRRMQQSETNIGLQDIKSAVMVIETLEIDRI